MRELFVVTGHTRGLGEGIADALRRRDATLVTLGRRPSGRRGEREIEVFVDLSRAEEAARMLQDTLLGIDWRDIDQACLVNNAGQLGRIERAGHYDRADVARTVLVDLVTPMLLTDAFLAVTERHTHVERRVLNVSSGAGRDAYAGWGAYCASKAGLDHFTRTLAVEGHPRLLVGSTAPGVIDTAMQAEIRAADPDAFPQHPRFVALHAEGRLRDPATAGEALVAHLLSEAFGRDPVDRLP